MKKIIFIVVLFIVCAHAKAQLLPNLGGQRAGTSAFTFLKLSNSPRQTSMGGIGIATNGDAYSATINPANIVDLNQLTFGLSNCVYFSDMHNSFISAVLPTKKYHRWAFHLQSFRSDAMEVRTEFQPNGTGEYFYTQNLAFGVSFAKILSDNFSYGITLKYLYEGIDQYNVHSGVMDVGFRYKTDFKDLKFAVMLSNFGPNTRIDGENASLSAFNNNSADINSYSAPTLFKMGLSLVPYKDERNELMASAELHHPNDNAENIRLGLEYAWMKILYVRAGYKIGVNDQSFPTMGLGLKTHIGAYPFTIDYAVDPHQNLGIIHQLGLSISIQKEGR